MHSAASSLELKPAQSITTVPQKNLPSFRLLWSFQRLQFVVLLSFTLTDMNGVDKIIETPTTASKTIILSKIVCKTADDNLLMKAGFTAGLH